MKRILSSLLCFCLVTQVVPVFSVSVKKQDKQTPRVLTTLEMDGIKGGGGKSSNSSYGSSTTSIQYLDMQIPDVPYVCQYVATSSNIHDQAAYERSKSYCGIAACCMIAAYNNYWKYRNYEISDWNNKMKEIDSNALDSFYGGVEINVRHDVNSGETGFMYHDSTSTSNKVYYSTKAVKDLFQIETGLSVNVKWNDSAGTAFDKLWDNVEDYSKPGLMVIKNPGTLHYILCTGIYRNSGGTRSIYKNDSLRRPEGGAYLDVSEDILEDILAISGNYGWVSDYQRGDAIYESTAKTNFCSGFIWRNAKFSVSPQSATLCDVVNTR